MREANERGKEKFKIHPAARDNLQGKFNAQHQGCWRGVVTGFLAVIADISERKLREAEREKMIVELREALVQVKTLSGLIPICAWCKSVRSDQGYWETVEQYVYSHTDATFTHGICPKCTTQFKAGTATAGAPA